MSTYYVTCVKTKQCNRMQLPSLDSIIRIRTTLNFCGHSCKNFEVTERMLALFNSDQMYQDSSIEHEDDNIETLCMM